jgi:hypothetical protein
MKCCLSAKLRQAIQLLDRSYILHTGSLQAFCHRTASVWKGCPLASDQRARASRILAAHVLTIMAALAYAPQRLRSGAFSDSFAPVGPALRPRRRGMPHPFMLTLSAIAAQDSSDHREKTKKLHPSVTRSLHSCDRIVTGLLASSTRHSPVTFRPCASGKLQCNH